MKTRPAGLIPIMIALCVSFTFLCTASPNTALIFLGDTSLTLYRSERTSETYLRLNEINIHAARDFAKRFRSVDNDKWLKADGGYLARFTMDDKRNDAFYDGMGRFIASSCYYKENNTPADIQTLISKEYPGYAITGLTRITTPERSFYRLHISNHDFVKTLQVINSRIQVLENLQNGANL